VSGLWLVCPRHSASPAVELPCVPHYCNIIEAPWLVNGGHGASLRHHILPLLSCPVCLSLSQAALGEELTIDVTSSTGKLQFKADMQMSMTAWMKALQEASQLTEPPPL
jgi:hypothetical protein